MASFCGVWMLADEPVSGFLSETDRRSLSGRLSLPAGKAVEISAGPLWLASSPERMRRGQDTVLAWDGFLPAPGPGAPDPGDHWEGHYSLAHANLKNRRLTLIRELSGGENLYFLRGDRALLFANSMRPLLAWREARRAISADALAELMFYGSVFNAHETLCEGIQEVRPGHSLTISAGEWRHQEALNPFLEEDRPSSGDEASPRALRKLLLEATGQALGADRRVAVALSGGIDSATIAALAAELLGPRNVTAFTYEFDEPTHPSETALAASTARHLGVDHRVVKIHRENHLESVPRYCWRVEDGRMRGNPSLMQLMEQAAHGGFRKLLSGHGIEQLLGLLSFRPYLRDLSARIPRTPFLDWTLRAKSLPLLKYALPVRRSWPPPLAIRATVLGVLRREGFVSDLTRFYPHALARWARRMEDFPSGPAATLDRQLMRASFHSYLTQRILWKKVAMARAAGIVFVAPALLRRCAVMAPRFAARTWSVGEDYSRHLQREAMAKDLPAQVLWRAKIDDENIAPAAWLGGMHAAVETATNGLAAVRSLFSPEEFSAAHDYYPYPLAQAALMSRIFLETPPREQPPLWEDLAP